MITLLIATAALVGLVFVVSAMIPHDGYGHRPLPRSHIDPFDNSFNHFV